HGVFIAERRAVGLTSVVAKVAAGALEYVPVARVTNLVRLIEQLKERNIWVVGAAGEAKQSYTDWDWKLPAAVFLGNEGHGLHRLVRAFKSPHGPGVVVLDVDTGVLHDGNWSCAVCSH
ncbi:MAG: TrmH family RNA methyltransferase, partial [Pyrinomonadaceae bacterium]